MSGFSVPRFPYTFVLRHLDVGTDTIARDMGYASWADYLVHIQAGGLMPTFASPAGIPRGRKATMVFTRTGEDVATIGMHFLHRDGSDVADFTDADSVTLETALLQVWADIRNNYMPSVSLDSIDWHRFGVGVRKPNPAVRTLVVGPAIAGTSTAEKHLPEQVALSVTFKTSVRKQWGRVYLPAPGDSSLDDGRIAVSVTEQIRTAFGTLADTAQTANLPLVVWSPRHAGKLLQYGHVLVGGVLTDAHDAELDLPDSSSFARTVDVVQVDDVPDTIRSRRVDKAVTKATHTLS